MTDHGFYERTTTQGSSLVGRASGASTPNVGTLSGTVDSSREELNGTPLGPPEPQRNRGSNRHRSGAHSGYQNGHPIPGGNRGSLALGNSPMLNDMEGTSSPSPSPPAYPPAPDSDGCASEAASTDGILRMVQAQRVMGVKQRFCLPDFAQSAMSVMSEGERIPSDRNSLEFMEKHLEANRMWYDKQWMQIQQAKAKLPSKSDKQTETEKELFLEPLTVDCCTECRPSTVEKSVETSEPIRISASAIARILSEELGHRVVITGN